jgi:L,D-transpeptidase catalytic domain
MSHSSFSRRDFLKLTGLSLGAMALNPFKRRFNSVAPLAQFPAGDSLGRVAVTPNFYSTELKAAPGDTAATIRTVGQDEVVVWLREMVGSTAHGGTSKRWVETPEGFIYSPHLQPVRNLPNSPIASLPSGKQGFWAEVTVPYVELKPLNAPISFAIKYLVSTNQPIRLYYSQIVWIDNVGSQDGHTLLYHFSESPGHGNGPGDVFLAEATAFRPLTADDVSPINANVDPATKKITIDATANRQTLSCFEGNNEVYFCRISSGYGDKFSTPTGAQAVERKVFSVHMAANTGSDSGYDTMAVPWPTFFNTQVGAAIHGVFWHNDFGVRRSHGCVNVRPEDAKWIYRWTAPYVSLDQSEIQLQWPNVGSGFSTSVAVSELKLPPTG